MNTSLLEIHEFQGYGYKPLIDFDSWRVAILRRSAGESTHAIESMERHTQTDEVFVLLCGKGILVLGGNQRKLTGIFLQEMDQGKIYNVKCNAWHTILLSRDASVLLVENKDTGRQNSEYISISTRLRNRFLGITQSEQLVHL